ncbi:MAG: hypothetical protein ACLFWD_02275 [Anaerolineales bacterium]
MQSGQEKFRCPECGSDRAEGRASDTPLDPEDRWQGILPTVRCALCGCSIPVHLAYRWDDRTLEQAQREWKDVYWKSQS